MNLRRGDKGPSVFALQRLLKAAGYDIDVDGDFGPQTDTALRTFQASSGLIDDGIAGDRTYSTLHARRILAEKPGLYKGWSDYKADRIKRKGRMKGYATHMLKSGDTIKAYRDFYYEAHALGTIVTSSGSRRLLDSNVSANRSSRSLHYLGTALDLYMYSGMVDPETDPYVVVADPDAPGFWRIYARVAHGGTLMVLPAETYKSPDPVETVGEFIDFTALAARHGWERIPARRSFSTAREAGERNDGAAEWWHKQRPKGWLAGVTTFGECLLEVWTLEDLQGTAPWQYADYLWSGRGYFDKR